MTTQKTQGWLPTVISDLFDYPLFAPRVLMTAPAINVKETDNEVKFINNREDVIDIDTGVIINTLPYVMLVAVAVVGLVLIGKSKKNKTTRIGGKEKISIRGQKTSS